MLPPISVPIVANTTAFNASILAAEAKVMQLATTSSIVTARIATWGAAVNRAGNEMLVLSGRLSVAVAAPILLAEKQAVSAYAGFNKAMTESLAIAENFIFT